MSSREISRRGDQVLQATHGTPDHPLKIGELEIPCYVLEDETRVLVLGGMLDALDMSQGTASKDLKGNRLVKFVSTKSLSPFINDRLREAISNPILFTPPTGGGKAYGYEATILADLCDALLDARKSGALHYQQEKFAERAEILVRGFARVGIIALVDEATGYQDYRARRELVEILDRYLSDQLLGWAKRFPDEFYQQLYRLRGWDYDPTTVKRTPLVGKLTNDLVYARLAPGILDELRKKNPRADDGRLEHHHHRWLNEDVGHPKLQEHLWALITLMRSSPNWRQFYRLLNRSLPKYDESLEMMLVDEGGAPV